MIRRLSALAMAIGALGLISCTSPGSTSGASRQGIISCFDTGAGLRCVDTPGKVVYHLDVDQDGAEDPFVCADAPSESDSDGEGDSDSTSGGDDEVANVTGDDDA